MSLSPFSLSQPCHPTGTVEAEELYLMLLSRAMKGDIVLVLSPNAAAEHFQPPNYKCKCSESDHDGCVAFLLFG